jgi:RNA polymerase sigma-70 factor (ECF subfamily)
MTQEFFGQLLEKNYVSAADRRRGRFRTFLLSSFEHFLAKEWRRGHCQKRGGGCTIVSLNDGSADTRGLPEPADWLTPEKMFDRQWAFTVLEQALAHLRREYADSGRGELFEALKPTLTGEAAEMPQLSLATRLHLQEGALRVAIHRLRQRYGEAVREEIANTLTDPADIQSELQSLLGALSG